MIEDGKKQHDVAFYSLPFMLHRSFVDYPYFSDLGMLINAGICRTAGIEVGVIDALAQPYSSPVEQGREHYWIGCRAERIFRLTEEMKPKIAVVCGHPFLNVHAKTNWLTTLLEGIRKNSPDCELVYADCYVGGMHFIDASPERIVDNYPIISHVVKYHADSVLPAFLKKLLNREIDGATVHQGLINDVSLSPSFVPAWENISLDDYQENIKKFFSALNRSPVFNLEERTIPAVISRGCKYNCSFCSSNPDAGNPTYLRMSERNISELIAYYKNELHAQRIAFLDGLVNPSSAIFDALLDILDNANVNYDFLNGIRADALAREQVKRMKGRVTSIAVSAESGDADTLKNIGKGMKGEHIENVAYWCREEGVPLTIHYVVGFPGEGIEAIQKTFESANTMKVKYGAFSTVQYATPFPGTRLFKESESSGVLKNIHVVDYSPHFSTGGLLEHKRTSDAELRAAFENWKRAERTDIVQKVIINLTYMCNNKCVFCAIGDRKKEHSSLEDVVKAITAYRKRGASLLDFDGGEPTLYPELSGVIKAAKKAGFQRVAVTTNGRKLSDESYARELINSGITDLLISLYSADADIHDSLTGVKGSCHETIEGIRNSVKNLHDTQSLSINVTLSAANYEGVSELARLVLSLGVNALNIQMLTPFGSAKKEHAVDIEIIIPHLNDVMKLSEEGLKIQIVNMPPCTFPGHEDAVAPDTAKRERDMVFIGETGTNLAGYLSTKRVKTKECMACVYMLVCDGKYQFQ